ncbi:hypothetical protein D6D23_00112 [Aureobasidium pullulans]|nr:hypothetical protein D6D23_00112 [Aureobasidium pullulans]
MVVCGSVARLCRSVSWAVLGGSPHAHDATARNFHDLRNLVQGLYHKRLFSDNRDLEHELSSKFGALASREGDHQYKGFLAKSPETWPWRVVRIAAVDAMILRHEKSDLMTFYDIDFAFANTSPDSKLRELLVHITTYDLDMGSTAREDLIGIPNEFLVDVSMTLSRRLPNRQCRPCYQSALSWVQQADAVPAHFHEPQDGPPWQTLNACYYHEHSTEEKRDCAARFAREKVLERREQDRNRG